MLNLVFFSFVVAQDNYILKVCILWKDQWQISWTSNSRDLILKLFHI